MGVSTSGYQSVARHSGYAVSMRLRVHPTELAICRLQAGAEIPQWARDAVPLHVSHTVEETSLVCPASRLPPDGCVRCECGFVAIEVAGPLDFALTGILASLAAPLADAGVSIFAISTFDTDYVLVREADLPRARHALEAAGHVFSSGEPAQSE